MKAAVLGAGPHGRRILTALGRREDVDVLAVVDRRPEALEHADIAGDVRRYGTSGELWERSPVDLVCVATNGPSHAALALEAMEHGATRILVEKPIACSVADAEHLMREAERRGVRLAVGQGRRHAPIYRWLRDEIRAGRLGSPRSLWVHMPGIGLGVRGIHSIDLIRFLADAEVQGVVGWVDDPLGENPRGAEFVDPGGMIVMDMGPRLRGVVVQNEDGAGPISVEVDLTAARIRLDERFGTVEIVERDQAVLPGPGRPPRFHHRDPPEGMSARLDALQMINGVVEELLGEGDMECDGHHGVEAFKILVGAYVSDRDGHRRVGLGEISDEVRFLHLPVT